MQPGGRAAVSRPGRHGTRRHTAGRTDTGPAYAATGRRQYLAATSPTAAPYPQRTAIPARRRFQANRIDIPPELTPAQEAAQRPQTTVAVPPTLNDYRPTGNATRAPIWSAEQAPAATSLSSRSGSAVGQ
ncbi:MAG: hypothetical protein R3E89_00170 [Thiolinea sp.]